MRLALAAYSDPGILLQCLLTQTADKKKIRGSFDLTRIKLALSLVNHAVIQIVHSAARITFEVGPHLFGENGIKETDTLSDDYAGSRRAGRFARTCTDQ